MTSGQARIASSLTMFIIAAIGGFISTQIYDYCRRSDNEE
jgi:hypothetical protein